MSSSVFILLSPTADAPLIHPYVITMMQGNPTTKLAVRGAPLHLASPQFSRSVFTSQRRLVTEDKRVSPRISSRQIEDLRVPLRQELALCSIYCGFHRFLRDALW